MEHLSFREESFAQLDFTTISQRIASEGDACKAAFFETNEHEMTIRAIGDLEAIEKMFEVDSDREPIEIKVVMSQEEFFTKIEAI